MKKKYEHIALFYLIFLISIKFFSLHIFTHSGDNHLQDCEICEYAIVSNIELAPTYTSVSIEPTVEYDLEQHVHSYVFRFTKQQIASVLFSRPPPKPLIPIFIF